MGLNIKWKFIHIKPNCYVDNSADYEYKYIFCFFSYLNLFLMNKQYHLSRPTKSLKNLWHFQC